MLFCRHLVNQFISLAKRDNRGIDRGFKLERSAFLDPPESPACFSDRHNSGNFFSNYIMTCRHGAITSEQAA
jgi:hypothetical protein